MSQNNGSYMNPDVAHRLLLYGVWIPHIHNVVVDGKKPYEVNLPPADLGLIMIPKLYEVDGEVHDLWEMNNEAWSTREEFWKSVFDIKARYHATKRDEFGCPKLEWPEQLMWLEASSNQERRAMVRNLLYSLQWMYLREISRITNNHTGKSYETVGEQNWGLSFAPEWYVKNKPLAFSFFQEYQSRITEDWRWVWTRHPSSRLHKFKQLVVSDPVKKKVKQEKAAPSSSLEEFEGFLG